MFGSLEYVAALVHTDYSNEIKPEIKHTGLIVGHASSVVSILRKAGSVVFWQYCWKLNP